MHVRVHALQSQPCFAARQLSILLLSSGHTTRLDIVRVIRARLRQPVRYECAGGLGYKLSTQEAYTAHEKTSGCWTTTFDGQGCA